MAVFVFMLAFVALAGAVLSVVSAVKASEALERVGEVERSVSLLWLAIGPNDEKEE